MFQISNHTTVFSRAGTDARTCWLSHRRDNMIRGSGFKPTWAAPPKIVENESISTLQLKVVP